MAISKKARQASRQFQAWQANQPAPSEAENCQRLERFLHLEELLKAEVEANLLSKLAQDESADSGLSGLSWTSVQS